MPPRFATLRIRIVDPALKTVYVEAARKHNEMVRNDPYPNSGFDLFMPATQTVIGAGPNTNTSATLVSQGIQALMTNEQKSTTTGYYLYARSSLSKTPLILANHVGIIDSGYRGEIQAAFRVLSTSDSGESTGVYTVEPFARLVQICAPNLQPFLVEIVDGLPSSTRGEGGFGSTNAV